MENRQDKSNSDKRREKAEQSKQRPVINLITFELTCNTNYATSIVKNYTFLWI